MLGIPLMLTWYKKLCLFYTILKEKEPGYLFNLISTKGLNNNIKTKDKTALLPLHTEHKFFKNLLFSSMVIKWNQIDPNLQSAASKEKRV